jgi:hypothetical protein
MHTMSALWCENANDRREGHDQLRNEIVGKVIKLVDREILNVLKDTLRHAKSNTATDKK